jgi:predicted nucleotidyltransferase
MIGETGMVEMPLRDELRHKRDALLAIAARHGASNLRLFGSVIRGEEQPDSDIDLIVDIEEDRGIDDYLALIEELEHLLARPVDLVIGRSLSPHFRPFIEAEAQPL